MNEEERRSRESPQPGPIDSSVRRGMLMPRLSRRDLLRYAGIGAGAIGLSALLEACGVNEVATTPSTGGASSSPSPGAVGARQPWGAMGPGSHNLAQARLLIPRRGWWRFVYFMPDESFGHPKDPHSFAQNDFSVTITVRNLSSTAPDTQAIWPGPDFTDWQSRLSRMLDSYPDCSLVVVEDEENAQQMLTFPGDSPSSHRSPTQEQAAAHMYAQMIVAAKAVCDPRGVEVIDGGLISELATFLTYQDLVLRGNQAAADAFWSLAADAWFSKSQAAAMYIRGTTWLNTIKSTGVRRINFHKYLPNHSATGAPNGGVAAIAAFFSRYTGLPAISNELGVRDTLISSIDSLLADGDHMEMAILYGGTGAAGAPGMWDGAVPNAIAQEVSRHVSALAS